MIRKLAFGTVGLLLLVSPLVVSAQTIQDLQAQIQSLIAQLATMQQQGGDISIPTPVPPGDSDDYPTFPNPQNTCPNLSITMQRGSRDFTTNGQVTELQIFLAERYDVAEESLVTGYFGKVTESYVIRFQNEHGLPAFGIVGRLTRAKIQEVCGGPTQGNFIASPQSGPAPLVVQFSTNADPTNGLTIDFGDGQTGFLQCAVGGSCLYPDHTYTSAGTYTAKLKRNPGPTESNCAGTDCWVVGTATITVVTIPPRPDAELSASPTSGTAPLTVSFGARGITPLNGDHYVDFGDGMTGVLEKSGCTTGDDGTIRCAPYITTHTYTSAGTYTTYLKKKYVCNAADGLCIGLESTTLGTITVTVQSRVSCTLDGVTVLHGQSRTFYSTRAAPYGCSMYGEPRTCTNGSLSNSSSFRYASCSVGELTPLPPSPDPLPPNPLATRITASPQTVPPGGSSTITWSAAVASGIEYCSLYTGSTYVTAGLTGSISTGPLTESKTYSINCRTSDLWQPVVETTVTVSSGTSSAAQNQNLANVLTALEEALKALIGKLGQ